MNGFKANRSKHFTDDWSPGPSGHRSLTLSVGGGAGSPRDVSLSRDLLRLLTQPNVTVMLLGVGVAPGPREGLR